MGKQSATLANEWKRDYDLENRWILVLFAKLIRVNYSQSRNESFKTCPSSPSLPFVKCTTTKRECSMPLLNSSHSFLRSLSPVWPCMNINKQQWILEEGFYGYEESFLGYLHPSLACVFHEHRRTIQGVSRHWIEGTAFRSKPPAQARCHAHNVTQ